MTLASPGESDGGTPPQAGGTPTRLGTTRGVTLDAAIASRLKRDANGLFTAVAQERGSGEVLMVAWMDDEALARTLATRQATYYSRSRQDYWVKGATSGNTQHVHSVRLDCDGDAVLLEVEQVGGACHTGDHSCFDADLLQDESER
jgi:phosphoribosyl-AMP cyclohydrolase